MGIMGNGPRCLGWREVSHRSLEGVVGLQGRSVHPAAHSGHTVHCWLVVGKVSEGLDLFLWKISKKRRVFSLFVTHGTVLADGLGAGWLTRAGELRGSQGGSAAPPPSAPKASCQWGSPGSCHCLRREHSGRAFEERQILKHYHGMWWKQNVSVSSYFWMLSTIKENIHEFSMQLKSSKKQKKNMKEKIRRKEI